MVAEATRWIQTSLIFPFKSTPPARRVQPNMAEMEPEDTESGLIYS
jgi:hypothetical protein